MNPKLRMRIIRLCHKVKYLSRSFINLHLAVEKPIPHEVTEALNLTASASLHDFLKALIRVYNSPLQLDEAE